MLEEYNSIFCFCALFSKYGLKTPLAVISKIFKTHQLFLSNIIDKKVRFSFGGRKHGR